MQKFETISVYAKLSVLDMHLMPILEDGRASRKICSQFSFIKNSDLITLSYVTKHKGNEFSIDFY